jgi:hypothetical protein
MPEQPVSQQQLHHDESQRLDPFGAASSTGAYMPRKLGI